MTQDELYALCHQIAKAQRALNAAVDKLLAAEGIPMEVGDVRVDNINSNVVSD